MFRGFVILSVIVLLSGCTAPREAGVVPSVSAPLGDISSAGVQGGTGGGSGRVENAPPRVVSMTADRTVGDNGGSFVVVFSGTIMDPNAERDLASIQMSSTGAAASTSPIRKIVNSEVKKPEPTEFGADGFMVWDSTNNDGAVEFRYRHPFAAFAPAGQHAFTLTVTDDDGSTATSAAVTITIERFSLITVGAPVDAAGIPASSWGGWSALPGATNVIANNYLRLINDGDRPDVRVVIDFTEGGFVGAEDAAASVPINGNLQFGWWEDVTPGTTSPTEKEFTWTAVAPDGSVTVSFTGAKNIIYVAYRIAQMPAIVPQQSYHAAFTVTEL